MESNTDIKSCCAIIDSYAKRKGISLAKLIEEFPALGSEKTFRDLRAGKTDGYDIANWLVEYQALAALVETLLASGGIALYETLPAVEEFRAALLRALQSIGTDRVVMVDGPSGVGKTTAALILVKKYGSRIKIIEASDMWNDSPSVLIDEILEVLGEVTPPIERMAKLRKCVDLLRNFRRTLIIDEAHHLGPRCLNVVKTLVNRTSGEFVLMGIPAMWAKMNKAAYIEARQLSTNRLSSRVNLTFEDADVRAYLRAYYPKISADALKVAVNKITAEARLEGCTAFVRDVCAELSDSEWSTDSISAAVDVVKSRRTAKRK